MKRNRWLVSCNGAKCKKRIIWWTTTLFIKSPTIQSIRLINRAIRQIERMRREREKEIAQIKNHTTQSLGKWLNRIRTIEVERVWYVAHVDSLHFLIRIATEHRPKPNLYRTHKRIFGLSNGAKQKNKERNKDHDYNLTLTLHLIVPLNCTH